MFGKGTVMKALIGIAAAGLLLAGCAGGGGSHPGDGNEHQPVRALLSVDALMFTSFDADGDLNVSSAEIDAGITREFARADANHDTQISAIEFSNWSNIVLGGAQTAPYRLDFDRNVDNVITQEEFANEIHSRANDYDENQDHVLSRSEFVRLVGQTRTPDQGGPNGMRRQMRPPGQGGPNGG